MNKTKFSVLFLVVALCMGLSAQAKFGFGPKIGMNVNQMSFSGTNLIDSDNRCGFTGGITAEYIAPVLGIGFDISLMYSYMETNVDVEAFGVTTSETESGSFLEIPLHLKYKLSLPAIQSIIAPYIYTGPSVAFKVSGDDSYYNTKNTQWGWDLGIGVELIRHLQIGAGYTWGINKIAEIPEIGVPGVNYTDDIKVKNNYWTITAAWMF